MFEHLSAYDPRGTSEFVLPIAGRPSLKMRPAGQSNAPYFNAMAKRNAKSGQLRRLAQGQVDVDSIDQNRKEDRELYPVHVIVGWTNVNDSEGKPVQFTAVTCREFLQALPDWIFDEVRNFAAIPANFLPDDEPTTDEVQEAAGN